MTIYAALVVYTFRHFLMSHVKLRNTPLYLSITVRVLISSKYVRSQIIPGKKENHSSESVFARHSKVYNKIRTAFPKLPAYFSDFPEVQLKQDLDMLFVPFLFW